MIVLAIESAANVAGAAIVDETKTIAEFTVNSQRNHAATLMPMVAQVLESASMTLKDMDYIACASGPGSFTGLRIGAATAKGLAHGADRRIVPVPTLDALAYNVYGGADLIVPVMDARRGQVYTAMFRRENGRLLKLTADTAQELTQTLETARETGGCAVFVGDGALVFKERILEAGFTVGPPHLNMHRAAAVGALAIQLAGQGVFTDYRRFTPEYIRAPQAEREYKERQEARGLRK